ncbi:hypothetical protein SERLA73DRAFT_149061 [Serpula lacrymans var. lacrymans S7.3]|uniref:Uncharacterized protein n=1 Tax=Serpula lacrymans var. lacrymans (strain S7.3) TaxID=936435 RepID=F8PI58_SERL3|nr:hypothetical protein SERLA73DRAFT_149061 [Serpula lacrymans var. lacrymans S7.3]
MHPEYYTLFSTKTICSQLQGEVLVDIKAILIGVIRSQQTPGAVAKALFVNNNGDGNGDINMRQILDDFKALYTSHAGGELKVSALWLKDAAINPINYGNMITKINVVDFYVLHNFQLKIFTKNHFVVFAMICQGVMPCFPIAPNVGITIDALKIYHCTYFWNSHFSIQAFVKILANLHEAPCKKHLFSEGPPL